MVCRLQWCAERRYTFSYHIWPR